MTKKMTAGKKRLVLMGCMGLFAFTFFLSQGCGGGGGGTNGNDPLPKNPGHTWSIWRGITTSSAAFGDINEMEQVGSSEAVNIVVQVEFSDQYSQGMPKNTLRGMITRDSNTRGISSTLTDIGNKDMGNKTTLTEFIAWVKTNYPADHYALVLWDHGAGWKTDRADRGSIRGALEDSTSGSFMSLPDIADGVRGGGVHLDLINFDACLMAMYEVAYEFNGLTDTMVFSEEVEPGEGDPYHTILKELVADPGMNAQALCQTIASEFKTFHEAQDRTGVTKSAVDMSYVSNLHEYISDLASLMNGAIGTERPNIQSARDNSTPYAFPENHDIGNFLDQLSVKTENEGLAEKINQIKTLLSRMIISNEVYSPDPGKPILQSTGLSIYLPKRDQVTNQDLTQYSLLAINQSKSPPDSSWGGFVNQLITGDEGDGLNSLETKPGNFIIWLEWDTDADLDLIVWEPDGTFAAPYIGASSPNGFLSEDSVYSGESIEYYAAAETVAVGDYDILVQYYSDGLFSTATTAYLFLYDPEEGDTDFQQAAVRQMSLYFPAPEDWYDDLVELENVIYDEYSDWWIPHTLTRTLSLSGLSSEAGLISSTGVGEKALSIRFSPSKIKNNRKKILSNRDNTIQIKERVKSVKEGTN